MLFPLRVESWHWPFLKLVGVKPDQAYVHLTPDTIHVRLGFWQHRFPRAHLAAARPIGRLPKYGLGWHATFGGILAIKGSHDGIVELRFDPPVPFRLLRLPNRCRRLYLSLADPDAFLRALAPAETGGR